MNANTIPLEEVIPWSRDTPRNILICDSVETDGSFVVATMTAHLLSPSSSLSSSSSMQMKGSIRQRKALSRALWLSGNSSTERQVASSLKKLGCDAGAAYLRNGSNFNNNQSNKNNGLTIRSLTSEIAEMALKTDDRDGKGDDHHFDGEKYLRNLYNDVKGWIDRRNNTEEDEVEVVESGSSWIIIDDVTALASILDDRLVYCFVESLISLVSRPQASSKRQCGLIIRCSGDVDQMQYIFEGNEGKDHSGWFGAGGLSHKQAVHDTLYRTFIPWERAIEESVDAIIDVLPLLSGFSREAHGRLIFSETPNGQGWKDLQNKSSRSASLPHSPADASKTSIGSNKLKRSNWNKLIFNYRLQDSGARAIRLRTR